MSHTLSCVCCVFSSLFQDKKETSRKQIKEAKNRQKKIRGTGRRIAKHKAKKAAK